MQLTIIEPHAHFELILALAPALHNHSGQIQIVASAEVRSAVQKNIPKQSQEWEWINRKEVLRSQNRRICIFTSLQNRRKPWLQIIQRHPSALLIHNLNHYTLPQPTPWVPRHKSSYSWATYKLKKTLQFSLNQKINEQLLSSLKATFHYSPNFALVENPIRNCRHFTLPLFYKQTASRGSYDLLPVYGYLPHIDWTFLEDISWSDSVFVICSQAEENTVRSYLPTQCIFKTTPLPYDDYQRLFQEAGRVIVPFTKDIPFGLVYETLEQTKSLARIHLAKQFEAPLLLPPDIPLPPAPPSETEFIAAFQELVAFLKES